LSSAIARSINVITLHARFTDVDEANPEIASKVKKDRTCNAPSGAG
jgi:hypothetical protein